MKKTLGFLLLVSLLMPFGLGAEEITSIGDVNEDNVGILPDSPLYFLKTWWEDVQMFFTFRGTKKAELELKFANKRIIELKKLCEEKDKCDQAKKLAPRFQSKIEKSIEKIEEASEKGKDVEAIIERLKENQEKQQAVLEGIYEKVPENAKEHILNAMEKSAEGISNAVERIQGLNKAEEFKNTIREKVESYGTEVKNKIKGKLQFFQD